MKSVQQYTNYRKFLLDYYKMKRKKKDVKFSYRIFAKQVKMANASFLHNIMHNRRKPDIPTVLNMTAAMGLDAPDTSYFAHLVEMNHAVSAVVKQFYQSQLALVKKHGSFLKQKKRKR